MQSDLEIVSPVQFLFSNVEESASSSAIIFEDKIYTYGDFLREVLHWSSFFEMRGVYGGARVAIYTDNDLEMFCALFALWNIGAVAIPMNVSQTRSVLCAIEDIVKPDFGFSSMDSILSNEYLFPFFALNKDSVSSASKVCGKFENDLDCIIMFTSGTSGVPKAVPITHGAISYNACQASKILKLCASDKVLINTPSYTTSSIIHFLTVFAKGGCLVVDRAFMFGVGLTEKLEKYQCTGFGGVPVHFTRLLAGIGQGATLRTLRFLMNSGDHLPVPILEQIRQAWPAVNIFCVYGLTEVSGRLCFLDPELLNDKLGSVGKPMPGMSITIRDEHGEELSANMKGEVYVNGPCLMRGYLNNQQENDKVMTRFGFSTGDIGYLDAEGYLYLSGRSDDVFKVGGEKVSCQMIEDSIFQNNKFLDFVVSPIYDEHMGNVPCLFYVLQKGQVFDRRGLIKELKKRLPATHIPAYFVQLEEIPRTKSGKPIRNKLSFLSSKTAN